MTSPAPSSTTGATAATPRRRRPVWAWLLLALVVIAIVIAILLLTGRCGSGSTAGAPPAPPAAGAPAAGAPAGAPGAAPGAPGADAPAAGAPGAPGTPGAGGVGGAGTAPGTPGGAPADPAALQSRIDEIVAAQPITFRANSAELTDAGAETLGRVAEELTAVPSARVTVTGYSAPIGGPGTPDPQQLSDQRATAAADALAADGVARDRLQTQGASDTNPRPDPASSRRAEVRVS